MTPVLATQILRDDHKRLTGLFRQMEGIDRRAHEAEQFHRMRQGVLNEIIMEIEIHSAIEKQIFYPALLAALASKREIIESPLSAAMVDQSIRDHGEVEIVIQRIRRIPMNGSDFTSQLDELEQLLRSHVEEEEQIYIPAAEELLKEDLSQLGAQMQDMRDDLLQQPKYESSRPEVVQNPNGGEQMRTTHPTL